MAKLISGFRILSPSRFGYLRSPVLGDGTPAAQADAFAALLDQLRIESAAVIGASAGGPTAVQFALRHPDRCWAIVLISALTLPPPAYGPEARLIIRMMFGSDFAFWLITRYGMSGMRRTVGGSQADWDAMMADPESRRVVVAMLAAHPISRRNTGLLNDLDHVGLLSHMDMTLLRVPALVVHGDADPMVPPANAQRVLAQAPQAEFLTIPGGGHLACVSHKHVVTPATVEFLNRHAPV